MIPAKIIIPELSSLHHSKHCCLSKRQQQHQHHQQQHQLLLPRKSHSSIAAATLSLLTKNIIFSPVIILLIISLSSAVSCVVVYQVRFIATKNGRTDYALAGESIELSCHYIMKDEAEDIKQLVWSKDGKNFLRWRKNKPGLEVLSYTFKGHIDSQSTHSHLTINNVTIDMHGKYKCSVKTDLGSHEIEQDLIVISQSNCRLNDWRVISQPSQCRELFKFDCKNMFPKPVPSCGLWNDKLEKFIRSVTIDISEEPNKQTYRIRYSNKFDLQQQPNGSLSNPINADLLQYAGHLVFKCDIIVPETSWKLSLEHKMFDFEDGCNQDPLESIEKMRLNYNQYATVRVQQARRLEDRHLNAFEMLNSGMKYEFSAPPSASNSTYTIQNTKVELNCWQKPRIGSLARLSCATKSTVKLVGAHLLECQPSGWVPVTEVTPNMTKKQAKRIRRPRPSRRVNFVSGDGSTNDEQASNPSKDSETANTHTTSTANYQRSPEEIKDEVISIPQGDSNDLEELSPPELNNEKETIPIRTEEKRADLQNIQQQRPPLTPAQLASLLPTCVSTIRRITTTDSNGYPMLDEVRTLESSNPNTDRQYPHDRGDDGQNRYFIFNFSSSGSMSTSKLITTRQALTLILLMLTTSIGMSILNMKKSYIHLSTTQNHCN